MLARLASRFNEKKTAEERQQLTPHFKIVAKCLETMRDIKKDYGLRLNREFFVKRHPNHVQNFMTKNIEDQRMITSELAESLLPSYTLHKHGVAVVNFMECVIEFVGGNEDSKPIMYALGKSHKECGITEKMFVEMKIAMVDILKYFLSKEQTVAWELTLEYVFINYIFRGMNMKSPLSMDL